MEFLNFNSVELLPNAKASTMFSVDSGSVFKEKGDINPIIIDERLSYMPWGRTTSGRSIKVSLRIALTIKCSEEIIILFNFWTLLFVGVNYLVNFAVEKLMLDGKQRN